eukprot:1174263-Prorocentrum_minimum.AAC.3
MLLLASLSRPRWETVLATKPTRLGLLRAITCHTKVFRRVSGLPGMFRAPWTRANPNPTPATCPTRRTSAATFGHTGCNRPRGRIGCSTAYWAHRLSRLFPSVSRAVFVSSARGAYAPASCSLSLARVSVGSAQQ